MKKILIVEDCLYKRIQLVDFLKEKEIEFEVCIFVYQALRSIRANKENIAGIILDLGLETMPGACDATPYRGLEVVRELIRKRLNIPVLINSTTEVEISKEDYPFFFGHRTDMNDYEILEDFISFLKTREEQ